MQAIQIIPGTGTASLVERDEPMVTAADEVKIRVWQVGICGTDREEAAGGRARAPQGRRGLVIGHEMFGQVTDVGAAVTKVSVGDFAVFTVRRGCGKCDACINNRNDMCYTGDYTERGINGADGYQSQYVVDREQYVVPVPAAIKDIGVLTEPMSVAAKAIDEAVTIQCARVKDFSSSGDWLKGKRALVAGIGPVGLLAAFALRIRGAEVFGVDIVDPDSLRPKVLRAIGGEYINENKTSVPYIDSNFGSMDFVFEASGIAELQMQLIGTLAINAVYVATGIPGASRPLTISAGELMSQLVLKNQLVLGSVNAAIKHYHQAVDYLAESKKLWPQAIAQVITHTVPVQDFAEVLHHHAASEIKAVIDWR